MGVKDFNHNVQEFFDLCRKGNAEAVTNWIQLKTKSSKSPLNFLRPTTPCPGWLTSLRDPSTSYTALHQASLHGHCDIVKLLVEQDQELVASKDRRGCLPIHLASWNGHVQVVEELLRADIGTINSVNNAKESPLHLAAQHGYGGVVSLLLKNRGNAQLRNARFETALDIAVRTGKENICKLLICYCPELVLQSAAECSTADNRTISAKIVYPLHSAARYGHTECLSVLCDSGFNVNYVTEEGSAVHVAAVFGQIESVRLLLSHGVDLGIKDSNGMTVLEKLEYYETRQHTDLTQVIQSKDSWAACKEMIEEFLGNSKSNVLTKANNNASSQSSKPVIWKTLPENSRAPDQKRTSSKCASTTSHNNQAGTSTSSTSRSNGHHPTAPTVVRPVFPITSPNMLGRSAVVPKRMKGSLPSGLIPVDQNPSNTLPTTCSYQAPPLYDAWTQPKPQVYNNVDNLISAQPPLPLSYDNVPRNLFIYDNAPPPNHRRWDHDCCVSQAKPGPISQNPTTISGGTARTDFLSHLCEDGSQTTPVKPTAATRLSVLQVFGGNNGSSKPQAHVSDSISADLLLSFGSPTKHLDGECSQVPSTFSTLERDGDYEGEVCADGEAPLALPEKGGSTSASSIVSISPERVFNLGFAKVHDAIDRRSTTLSSNTRSTRSSSTLILDKQDASESIIKEEADEKPMTNATCLEKEEPSRHLALTAITPTNARLSDDELISPTATELSDNTIASSCSLQMISQISSTPPSPIDVQTIFKASPSPSRSISIDQNKKKYSWFKREAQYMALSMGARPPKIQLRQIQEKPKHVLKNKVSESLGVSDE